MSADILNSVPTPYSRLVSYLAVPLSPKHDNMIVTRDVHTAANIVSITQSYSRASFDEMWLDIVPRANMVGVAVTLNLAWTHGLRTPTSAGEIMELPHSQVVSFGSSVSLPSSVRVPHNFADSYASNSFKPAPVEGARARLVILARIFQISEGSSAPFTAGYLKTDQGSLPVLDVYIKGRLVLAGVE